MNTLEEYSKSLGLIETMSIERLIASHKHLVEELNNGQRKEWKDNMIKAAERAYSTTLDSLWIKKDDLKNMTISQLISELE